jgi:hypothetical protein
MVGSWRSNPAHRLEQSGSSGAELRPAGSGFFLSFAGDAADLREETSMNAHATFIGIAGGLLLTAIAGSANAQARFYPDGTNCSLLSDGELVACQNQIYTRQLESGLSHQTAEPGEIPSSHIEGNEAGQSDFVPGAEGTELPSAYAPITAPGTVYSTLPGPEGTVRIYGPTE